MATPPISTPQGRLQRRLSRSDASRLPLLGIEPRKEAALRLPRQLLRRLLLGGMSSYGAIGGASDEFDDLLQVEGSGTPRRPVIGDRSPGGMRRVASAVDQTPAFSRSPSASNMRRNPSSTDRRPYLYTGGLGLGGDLGGSTHSLSGSAGAGAVPVDDAAARDHNMAIRYRLFNRLDPGGQTLRMPDHVIPAQYFSILPFDEFMDSSGKQNSFVTIFSIWNTMMGTSLLAMPWALQQAGLVWGIFLMLAIAGVCLYTANLVVQSPKGLTLGVDSAMAEFSDVCRYLFGVWGERAAVGFSIVVLLGGVIVYWVLMSNFLYYTGTVVYEALQPNSSTIPIMENKTFTCDVYCPEELERGPFDIFYDIEKNLEHSLLSGTNSSLEDKTSGWTFDSLWQLQGTVPLYLAILCFPLLNFKSPTFFTKFNVLGTVSVFYLLSFTASKLFECGFNIDFSNPASIHHVKLFNWRFPALTGTLTLSYFIHNAILTILRNQKHPENNGRDLTIGYVLAAASYVFIGFAFFAAFPVQRSCIADNFLNNFGTGDVMSATARLFLLFQMLTVLPLLMYLIRSQFFYAFTGKTWPGTTKVCALNGVVIALAAAIAIFYPKVGSILRYVGSMSGLVYVFALPCLVHIQKMKQRGELTKRLQYSLYFVVGLGVANMLAQFVI